MSLPLPFKTSKQAECLVQLAFVAAITWLCPDGAATLPPGTPEEWRAQRRIIDLHQHITAKPEFFDRAVRIMDRAGVGIGVNITAGTSLPGTNGLSEFESTQTLATQQQPGRFLHYVNLDFRDWDAPGFSELAVRQVEEGARQGAAGLKEWKRLGLYLRNKKGELIQIDDPKLDPVWKRCGELGLPVSIHVADPRAFWLPYDPSNERWKELKDHRSWWFGDPAIYPRREALLEALDRVIGRHPGTTFVCVHFANNAEDLEWVDAALTRHPNMWADLAARIPEIGRHPAEKVRALFEKHQDRIVFATDFQVHNTMILGSSGSGPAPTEDDAVVFFQKQWRWMETSDRQFEHMTPIQGDWRIDAIQLPLEVLRKIYFDNAKALLVRSLPPASTVAMRVDSDFDLSGRVDHDAWQRAPWTPIEHHLRTGRTVPEIRTRARLLWSDNYLYIGYESAFTQLTTFDPPIVSGERSGLWDRDVVEAFIGTEPDSPRNYTEYEVAPTGEKLDLDLGLKNGQLEWQSGFTSRVNVDSNRGVWTCEMRIPMKSLSKTPPRNGQKWRLNLYRHDIAHKSFMAWNPTASPTAHAPERFGFLTLVETVKSR